MHKRATLVFDLMFEELHSIELQTLTLWMNPRGLCTQCNWFRESLGIESSVSIQRAVVVESRFKIRYRLTRQHRARYTIQCHSTWASASEMFLQRRFTVSLFTLSSGFVPLILSCLQSGCSPVVWVQLCGSSCTGTVAKRPGSPEPNQDPENRTQIHGSRLWQV